MASVKNSKFQSGNKTIISSGPLLCLRRHMNISEPQDGFGGGFHVGYLRPLIRTSTFFDLFWVENRLQRTEISTSNFLGYYLPVYYLQYKWVYLYLNNLWLIKSDLETYFEV